MKKVSVIIPCFNEQDNIAGLYEALRTLFAQNAQYEWEAIMIDDGSCDGTLSEIKRINRTDRRIRYGDCAVIMDADLQHPPSLIPMMLRHWEEGFDDVYAERRNRGRESWLRRRLSMAYYRMLQRMAKIEILPNVGDFRLLDRKCIDSMRRLRETQRYTKGLYCWIGFRKKKIVFDQGDRVNGCSSFSYMRLFDLAVEGITSYTTAPLRISTWVGILVSFVAFIYMCYVLVKTMAVGDPVQGYPTLIIVILFLGGIQLLSLGIIGEYLGRVFNETKRRPPYIVRETDSDNAPADGRR